LTCRSSRDCSKAAVSSRAAHRWAASSLARKEDVNRLSARLRAGDFDLVLWPLGLTGPPFFDVLPRFPHTRFVFLDYCCVKGSELHGAPNATTVALRADKAAHLAGYLSGLMEARRPLRDGGRHMVSIIVGDPVFRRRRSGLEDFPSALAEPFQA